MKTREEIIRMERMTDPTDTEINEGLAQMLGWHLDGDFWWDSRDVIQEIAVERAHDCYCEVWHPASDLNQMRLVETRLIELGLWNKYIWALEDAFDSKNNLAFHATARQKAEAAYKVWKERK